MKVITNNTPRDWVYGFQLSDSEVAEVNDMEGWEDMRFFRYRGDTYLEEFMAIDSTMLLHHPELREWSGYMSDSFFSGIVVKYTDDFEQIIVGSYCV